MDVPELPLMRESCQFFFFGQRIQIINGLELCARQMRHEVNIVYVSVFWVFVIKRRNDIRVWTQIRNHRFAELNIRILGNVCTTASRRECARYTVVSNSVWFIRFE